VSKLEVAEMESGLEEDAMSMAFELEPEARMRMVPPRIGIEVSMPLMEKCLCEAQAVVEETIDLEV
jgi:hypothetical protein